MTLGDLFDAMWSISSVQITCRDDGKFMHSFYFDPEEPRGNGLRIDIASEKVTYIVGPINVHGGREMGWGYKRGTIPNELMNAEIDHLGIANYQRGYDVRIDTEEVPELMVEFLKKKLEKKKWRPME